MTLCGCNTGKEVAIRMVFYKPDYQAMWDSDEWDLKEGDYTLITGVPGAIPRTDQVSHEYQWCLDCAVNYRMDYPDGQALDLKGSPVDLWGLIDAMGEPSDG